MRVRLHKVEKKKWWGWDEQAEGKAITGKVWTKELQVSTYEFKLGKVVTLIEQPGYLADSIERLYLKNKANLTLE